ncbi:hypothetical protein DRP77_01670 [Candidatus Poribacteria bacterium]|nr:MAG: hypothetical protein DRP77_01670 [Candidatus Poribacteria bacterium]
MRWASILVLTAVMTSIGLSDGDLVFLSTPERISASPGQEDIKVPVYISDLTGMNIISAEIEIGYDPDVVEATGVDFDGTIAEGSSSAYKVKSSSISIAFTRANPFSGGSVLVYVLFDAVVQDRSATSELRIIKAKLNEGRGYQMELGTGSEGTAPTGRGSVEFEEVKLKIEFASNKKGGRIRVTLVKRRPPGEQPAGVASVLNRYWVIERETNGEFEASLTFTLGPGMIGPGDQANPSNLILFRRDTRSTGAWSPVAHAISADASTGEVRFDGITEFSQFTIGSIGDSSLPVGLSSISAEISENGVTIKWTTQTEVGVVGFIIYRGESEGERYARIGFVPASLSSSFPTDYEFKDEDVKPGHAYRYYVESVDVSGSRSSSPVIEITIPVVTRAKRSELLQNYPNPFNAETWIPFRLEKGADVIIYIHSPPGELIRKLELGWRSAGSYLDKQRAAYWDGRDELGQPVPSGVYFYTIEANGFRASRKMVIVK